MRVRSTLTSLDSMTVEITVTRQFRIRMWLGLKLIRLGVWVTGAACEVTVDDPA